MLWLISTLTVWILWVRWVRTAQREDRRGETPAGAKRIGTGDNQE